MILVGEVRGEVLGKEQARRPLEPDVEEVGQLGIRDVVVVRRVHYDAIDAGIRQAEGIGRAERNLDRAVGSLGLEERLVAVTPDAGKLDEFVEGLAGLLDSPVVTQPGNRRGHLTIAPLEGEVVPIEIPLRRLRGSACQRTWTAL